METHITPLFGRHDPPPSSFDWGIFAPVGYAGRALGAAALLQLGLAGTFWVQPAVPLLDQLAGGG
jgi:hypothetical protein